MMTSSVSPKQYNTHSRISLEIYSKAVFFKLAPEMYISQKKENDTNPAIAMMTVIPVVLF